jgi:hypothetical protein
VEDLQTKLGTKKVDRKRTKRHFCFLLTIRKLSLFRTTRMLYIAKMTVVLLSATWEETWKQTQSRSINISLAAVQKGRIPTGVTSSYLLD